MSEAGVEFPDPTPWSDEELKDMRDPRLEPVNEVIRVLGEIAPLSPKADEYASMDDQVGQRLAALKFEVNACDAFQGHGLGEAAELLAGLREEYTALANVIRSVEQTVGALMSEKRETIEGVGTLERHRDKSRRNWQHDDLLRVVLDSDRRPKGAASDTGELESDLDVLRDVYGLRGYNARTTSLRDRGINPDEYAESEDRGWRVSIK